MPSFRTRFKGKAVRFSGIDICRLLVGTCGRFGGRRGRLHVLQLYPTRRRGGIINEVAAFDTVDGVNDCCWSESHQSLAVSTLTDGTVKLWDVSLPPALNPVSHFCEHYDEARSVDWNPVSDCFLSASLDSQIKLWTPDRSNSSYTFQRHSDSVYSVAWNAIDPHVFASGDGTAGLWDVRDNRCFTVIHDEKTRELVSCGWNTYSQFHLATASGSSIHVWDIRTTRSPLVGFCGHDDTVCRIRFSPHQPSMLLSCSVDNTVRTWDWREVASIARYDLHTDRVYGIDMSVHIEGLIASAGWDNLVHIWRDRPVTATLSASP